MCGYFSYFCMKTYVVACGYSLEELRLWSYDGPNPIWFCGKTNMYLDSPLAKNYVYCPFDISRKDVFCLAFNLKWNDFVLTDCILSETICLFYFCVLFSNMYHNIKFITKNWSDLCNFYSKVIFWNFCLRTYFLFFFAEFELLMFHNNIVKISEKLNKQNLLKICSNLPTLQISA